MISKGITFIVGSASYLLFGFNVLYNKSKLLDQSKLSNNSIKSSFLSHIMKLWVGSSKYKPTQLSHKELDKHLEACLAYFKARNDSFHTSQLAFRLYLANQDTNAEFINALKETAKSDSADVKPEQVKRFFHNVMSTLLKVDDRKMYITIERILNESRMSNVSYISQVINLELAERNWPSFQTKLVQLTHQLDHQQAIERVGNSINKHLEKIAGQGNFSHFCEAELIVSDMGYSNIELTLHRLRIAFQKSENDLIVPLIERYTNLANGKPDPEQVSIYLKPLTKILAAESSTDKLVALEATLSHFELSNIEFAAQAFALTVIDKGSRDGALLLKKVISYIDLDNNPERVIEALKPTMRKLSDAKRSTDHDLIITQLEEIGLSSNEFMLQKILLCISENRKDELSDALRSLDGDLLERELNEYVYIATRNHMKLLVQQNNSEEYIEIEKLLRNTGFTHKAYINQRFYFELKNQNFSDAEKLIDQLPEELQPHRNIALLQHIKNHAEELKDEQSIQQAKSRLIEAILKVGHLTPSQSFQHCETIFSTCIVQGNYSQKALIEILKKSSKDEIITLFLKILHDILADNSDTVVDEYQQYFSHETDRKEALDALYRSLHLLPVEDRQNALIQLFECAKQADDLERQLFIIHQLKTPLDRYFIDDELPRLHHALIEKSECDRVKPFLSNQVFGKKRINIVLLTCIWQRYELTKVVLDYYRDLSNKLSDQINLVTLVVGSEGKPDYLDAMGHEYVHAENKPLSFKWQAGISAAEEIEHDAVVIVGSDDLISEKQFRLYVEALHKGYLFYGVADLAISNNSRSVYWPGYQAHFTPRRFLESIGAARMIAKPLLKSLDYKLWNEKEINKGLDRLITDKLDELGFPRSNLEYCPTITHNNQTYYWGQVLHSYKDTKTFTTDFKVGGGNITAFESFIKNGNCEFWVTREDLVKEYGEPVISKIDELNNASGKASPS